jgi:hypothetical protein
MMVVNILVVSFMDETLLLHLSSRSVPLGTVLDLFWLTVVLTLRRSPSSLCLTRVVSYLRSHIYIIPVYTMKVKIKTTIVEIRRKKMS